ncbi:catechol 1,2-dioxygenase [Neptunomonas sp. CHC150]|uniref:catechol 1,2-dioxygenase n=1 Tax=Neptunomonas TaxID=75687 RepID=UPI0009491EC4|nr:MULTISPECIES: catechol 1,2-dioxygenase [Neptunomonas]MDN2659896.1 catechol 1,2-dioxygenase [Neptunomonas sp. CHC150]
MSVKTMNTAQVQSLLKKVAGMDKEGGDERFKHIVHRVVRDLYQAIEDFDVTPEEFWSAVYYINDLGKNGEAALLAPGLGFDHYLDIRMDAEDEQAGLTGGTPRTIEGPLYVAGAPLSEGFARMDDGSVEGETMIFTGVVTDEQGQPIEDAIVDIWHADVKGRYSYFDPSQSDYNLRRRIKTGADGRYTVRSYLPSGYGCPPDGSTQLLLDNLGRHGQRPAHIHFFVTKPGFRHLTSQINVAGDKYTYDDFAFATKDELVVEAKTVSASPNPWDIEGDYKKLEFNITLLNAPNETAQERHARVRALEADAA